MLISLKIRNYALIKDLDIHFRDRLNTITGETGAGKSIMLGALGLILGKRADTSSLLDTSNKCIVEGTFQIDAYNLQQLFAENDLDYEAQTIFRREISPSGKSRAFINDTPVNLNTLRQFGIRMVDIHSQHQTIRLSDTDFQITLLNAFSGVEEEATDYANKFKIHNENLRHLETLRNEAARMERDREYFRFQYDELQKVQADPDAFRAMEEEYNLLDNAETIKLVLQQCIHNLSEGEGNINSRLVETESGLQPLTDSHQKLEGLVERLKSSRIELEDISTELQQFDQDVQVDESRKAKLGEQISIVNSLLKKHGLTSVEELHELTNEISNKLNSFESLGEDIEALEKSTSEEEKVLKEHADTLHSKRQQVLLPLSEKISTLLQQLGMPDGVVKLQLNKQDELTRHGWDKPEFLFSANRGSAPKPVQQAASGGELSRLMLALKYLLADKLFLPTIVFDEIDSGISGEVSMKVGELIRRMADAHQIICVTHLPQIAALGNGHYKVYKSRNGEITETLIKPIEGDDRILEIAQMLDGDEPSEVAVQNARQLVNKNP